MMSLLITNISVLLIGISLILGHRESTKLKERIERLERNNKTLVKLTFGIMNEMEEKE